MDFTLEGWMLIALGIAVLAVLVLLGWWMARARRSRTLKKQFGPEYEHEVATVGGRAKAEDELEVRRKRVKEYELRELAAGDKQRFADRWRELQKGFVDHPSRAVSEAAVLIDEAMEARGYPMGEIRRKEADLSVHYPQEVQDYRTAWSIAERNRRGEATTEELREAIVRYRNLFEHLVGLDHDAQRETA